MGDWAMAVTRPAFRPQLWQCRRFSSGIRQILRALVDQADMEEANVSNQLFRKQQKQKNDDGKAKVSALVKAEIERRVPTTQPETKITPPVPTWRTRETWGCVKGCGACCFLEKGPEYPPVEQVLKNPSEAALYKSMIGKDGWCKQFDKRARQCTIYNERPRFCRIEPEIFEDLYGIPEHKLDKEACSLCRDSITDVYGCKSKEMKNFERLVAGLKKQVTGQ